MANTAKPAFDYKAHQQALAQFTEMLTEHQWSFQADSYHELCQAQALEIDLFRHAQTLGIQGVDEFVYQRQQALNVMLEAEYNRGAEWQKRMSEGDINYYKKQLEETRAKYMKPIDFFEEKIQRHDWYYSFSDDAGVYRRGKAQEVELERLAKEGGPEFQKVYDAARQAYIDNVRKS